MSTRRGFFAALIGLAAACVVPFKSKPVDLSKTHRLVRDKDGRMVWRPKSVEVTYKPKVHLVWNKDDDLPWAWNDVRREWQRQSRWDAKNATGKWRWHFETKVTEAKP